MARSKSKQSRKRVRRSIERTKRRKILKAKVLELKKKK